MWFKKLLISILSSWLNQLGHHSHTTHSSNNKRCNIIKASSGTINVNGQSFTGKSVSIIGNDVYIDNVKQVDNISTSKIQISIEGNCELSQTTSGNIQISGKCHTVSTTSGDVNCVFVSGDINTISGDVNCKEVMGNIKTVSGDVTRN